MDKYKTIDLALVLCLVIEKFVGKNNELCRVLWKTEQLLNEVATSQLC